MKTGKFGVEIAVAVCTALMAACTAWLAWETSKLEKSWRETSREQLEAWFKTSSQQNAIKAWLELETRFDSQEMKRARKKLAQQLKVYSVAEHASVSETVLNFFEDVGTLYNQQYLDKKLARSTFSFYACRWWEAARAYVDQERKRHHEDATIFEEFESSQKSMRLPGEVIDDNEIRRFLDDEMKLD